VVLLSTACGKSPEEVAAERAAAEAREAADALKEAAGTSATAAGGGDTPAEPVALEDLQASLPDMPGWQRGEPRGERMTSPIAFSQTEADYTTGESSISIKLVDSAFNQLLIAPWAMFLSAGYERESGDGYEKAITVEDNPGFERYNKTTRDGELNLVIAKRFLVTIEGDNIDDTQVLHAFASRIAAGGLASIK
jgi:hypothetical protein